MTTFSYLGALDFPLKVLDSLLRIFAKNALRFSLNVRFICDSDIPLRSPSICDASGSVPFCEACIIYITSSFNWLTAFWSGFDRQCISSSIMRKIPRRYFLGPPPRRMSNDCIIVTLMKSFSGRSPYFCITSGFSFSATPFSTSGCSFTITFKGMFIKPFALSGRFFSINLSMKRSVADSFNNRLCCSSVM